MVQRTLASGSYFVCQSFATDWIKPILNEQFGINGPWLASSAGILAGTMNATINKPLTLIKYQCWNKPNADFVGTIKYLYKYGGTTVFFKGHNAMVLRDSVFGLNYERLRHTLKNTMPCDSVYSKFASYFTAASFACASSAAFNLARNEKYTTPANQKPPSIADVGSKLWQYAKVQSSEMNISKLRYRKNDVVWV